MLIAFSAVLLLAERVGRGQRSLSDATWLDALLIGGAQAISLVPGVSRSGITISAGLFRNFNRQDAARYSFLLSTPAIGGAALLKFTEAARDGTLTDDLDQMLFGAAASADRRLARHRLPDAAGADAQLRAVRGVPGAGRRVRRRLFRAVAGGRLGSPSTNHA